MLPKAINDLSRANGPIAAELESAATRVLKSGWFVLGGEVAGFEAEFAAYCGASQCVSVANGTDGLEFALRAVGAAQGARVATVANAGMYSSCAIAAIGARPVYVDIDPDTMLMSAADLSARIAGCAAVIATHLYGRLADMEAIAAVAAKAGVPVIEDCAQSHGARRNGRMAGGFGAAACYSFYPTKNLGALGDGGAVVTGDAAIAARVKQLRQYGWRTKYIAEVAGGRNSRLDELQAALLRVKLPLLDGRNERRRAVARRYLERIRNPGVVLPGSIGEDFVAHLFVVRTPWRDALAAYLRAASVPVDIHYPLPDYRQEALRAIVDATPLPHTEAACASVLTLPCFPEMHDAEVDAVSEVVNRWAPGA